MNKPHKQLHVVAPKETLMDAMALLVLHKVHRVPIVDPETNAILHILTHARILRQLISMVCASTSSSVFALLFCSNLQY